MNRSSHKFRVYVLKGSLSTRYSFYDEWEWLGETTDDLSNVSTPIVEAAKNNFRLKGRAFTALTDYWDYCDALDERRACTTTYEQRIAESFGE